MGNIIFINAIRAVVIILLQLWVLKPFSWGWTFNVLYLNILLYPLIILLLPIRTHQLLILFIGFFLGLLMDNFYDSPGVHASATVATAFFRTWVLAKLEPWDGYQQDDAPTKERFGWTWFLRYFVIMMSFHLFVYYMVETFAIAYFSWIIVKTFFTLIWSIFAVILFMQIWKSKV